jgi:hypothetical protein
MDNLRQTLSLRQKPATIRWLFVANWILLGVAWVLSIYGYVRLPQEVSSWLSLWTGDELRVERSLTFFLYPVSQVVFFFAFLYLAKILFVKTPEPGRTSQPLDPEKTRRMQDLKREVVYLALIFFNLIFIHLQTSLILLSHRIGTGINKRYFSLLIMIILILIPYYHIRRKMILTERS